MLYRAAGDDKEHVIRLGLAVSENGFDFRRVGDSPVFGPSADGPDGGCVEDPRIVKFDNEFYITYAYRAHAPGQYWTFAHDVVRLPQCGAYAPAAMAQNLGNTGLAVTTDFRNFRPAGAAYVARARRSGRDPFPGENRREVRHDAPSQTVRGRTLRGEIPFDLAEVLRRPAGMGGQAQPSAYRRPRRNLGGEDRRKHAADPDRGRVADALPRELPTAARPNTASGRCCSTGRIHCGCWPGRRNRSSNPNFSMKPKVLQPLRLPDRQCGRRRRAVRLLRRSGQICRRCNLPAGGIIKLFDGEMPLRIAHLRFVFIKV